LISIVENVCAFEYCDCLHIMPFLHKFSVASSFLSLSQVRTLLLSALSLHAGASAEQYQVALCYVLCRANPSAFLSHLAFVRAHVPGATQLKCVSDFCVAARCLQRLTPPCEPEPKREPNPDEYLVLSAPPLRSAALSASAFSSSASLQSSSLSSSFSSMRAASSSASAATSETPTGSGGGSVSCGANVNDGANESPFEDSDGGDDANRDSNRTNDDDNDNNISDASVNQSRPRGGDRDRGKARADRPLSMRRLVNRQLREMGFEFADRAVVARVFFPSSQSSSSSSSASSSSTSSASSSSSASLSLSASGLGFPEALQRALDFIASVHSLMNGSGASGSDGSAGSGSSGSSSNFGGSGGSGNGSGSDGSAADDGHCPSRADAVSALLGDAPHMRVEVARAALAQSRRSAREKQQRRQQECEDATLGMMLA
jgi:hypothetical protein